MPKALALVAATDAEAVRRGATRADIEGRAVAAAGFGFVRHNARNETVSSTLAAESAALDRIVAQSAGFGASLAAAGDSVRVLW